MRVGVVDLGGNTARLLVAEAGPQGLERLVQERVVLGLGAEIERRGRIPRARLAEAAGTVAALYARARDEECCAIEVLVTSPGRRTADRIALERAFTAAGPMRVRFVSPHEEARLAYVGARALGAAGAGRLAVCDVGGGSTEIAAGSDPSLPSWCRSVPVGSLQVTQRHFGESPATEQEIARARFAVRDALATLAPTPTGLTQALVSGGTARALRRLAGRTLGPHELAEALAIVSASSAREVARSFGLPVWRARTLLGGTIVLAELQTMLGAPLEVAAGGLREGAALGLLTHVAAAA